MKTTIIDMGITIEITTSNNDTRKCTTTIYNTANGALTSGISAFVQLLAQIIKTFSFLIIYTLTVFEIQHKQ